MLSQAVLSAVGSCSHAGKQCPFPASHIFVSCLCFHLISLYDLEKMPLDVGYSQFGFHLIPCGFFSFKMEMHDRRGGLKWSDWQRQPCYLVPSVP